MEKDSTGSSANTRPRRGGRAPKALGAIVEKVTKPLFGNRGLADGTIVRHWPAIMGAEVARATAPEKLVFAGRERRNGTLHLRVATGAAATVIQHNEPIILERINGYFGYRAVARLLIKQGPVAKGPEGPATAPDEANTEPDAEVTAMVAPIEDPDLREALESLGRLVKARSRRRENGG
jgi:hypothetical protein